MVGKGPLGSQEHKAIIAKAKITIKAKKQLRHSISINQQIFYKWRVMGFFDADRIAF